MAVTDAAPHSFGESVAAPGIFDSPDATGVGIADQRFSPSDPSAISPLMLTTMALDQAFSSDAPLRATTPVLRTTVQRRARDPEAATSPANPKSPADNQTPLVVAPSLGAAEPTEEEVPPGPVAAPPVNSTVTLELFPNYNTVGVRLYYTEDPQWAGTHVTATLRVLIGGQWVDAHDFVKDVSQRMLVTKVFGLHEGLSYSFIATFQRYSLTGSLLETRTAFSSTRTQVTPQSALGSIVWVGPHGNDFYPGTYELPKRTIAGATIDVQPGGSIVLKDGDYFFSSAAQQQTIRDKDGTPTQYYTLRAEHPGAVRIFGYEEVRAPWTHFGNGIYWTDASAWITTFSGGQYGPNRLVDTATGNVLYTYRSLTVDNHSQSLYSITQHPEAGWYLDFNTRRLYVKLASRTAPAAGQIRLSRQQAGVALVDSSYWIVEGLHFEQFGRSFLAPGAATYYATTGYGVGIYGGDHVVVRNNTFLHAGLNLAEGQTQLNNVLIAGNDFRTNGLWNVFFQEPFDTEYWLRVKNTPLECFAIVANGLSRGLVVRGNRFEGFSTSVNLTSTQAAYVNDVDVHDNASFQHLDDVYEADSWIESADGGNVNTAIFNNTSYEALTFVSASPFARGPLWVIGNHSEQNLFQPVKPGQQVPTDALTNTTGWKLLYNNVFLTSRLSTNHRGAAVWAPNLGYGNLVAKNNIFVGTSEYVFDEVSLPGAHRAPSLFQRNVFYSLRPGAGVRLGWENISANDEDTLDALAPLLDMVDNLFGVNPYPGGFTGPLSASLVGQGVAVKGITSVAWNGSRYVNRQYQSLVTRNYGRPSGATWLQGDFNRDGSVSLLDLLRLNQTFAPTTATLPVGSPPTDESA